MLQVTYFISLAVEIVHRTVIQQRGKEVMENFHVEEQILAVFWSHNAIDSNILSAFELSSQPARNFFCIYAIRSQQAFNPFDIEGYMWWFSFIFNILVINWQFVSCSK
jgi:hypothetical protein